MDRPVPELWILRHGRTEWNDAGRLQGRLDSPLTPLGEAQARRQGAILEREVPRRGVRLFSSPAGRAWRTACLAGRGAGLSPEAEPALMELGLGEWQGRHIADIRAHTPGLADGDDPTLWKFAAPGGEGMADLEARLRGFVGRLSGPAVLVTHGVTSRALRCLVLRRSLHRMSDLPGGQGVVHHIRGGVARIIE